MHVSGYEEKKINLSVNIKSIINDIKKNIEEINIKNDKYYFNSKINYKLKNKNDKLISTKKNDNIVLKNIINLNNNCKFLNNNKSNISNKNNSKINNQSNNNNVVNKKNIDKYNINNKGVNKNIIKINNYNNYKNLNWNTKPKKNANNAMKNNFIKIKEADKNFISLFKGVSKNILHNNIYSENNKDRIMNENEQICNYYIKTDKNDKDNNNSKIDKNKFNSIDKISKTNNNKLNKKLKTNIPIFEDNEYEKISVIGKGSFGKVYLYRDKKNHKDFAMKSIICKDNYELEKNIK